MTVPVLFLLLPSYIFTSHVPVDCCVGGCCGLTQHVLGINYLLLGGQKQQTNIISSRGIKQQTNIKTCLIINLAQTYHPAYKDNTISWGSYHRHNLEVQFFVLLIGVISMCSQTSPKENYLEASSWGTPTKSSAATRSSGTYNLEGNINTWIVVVR